jgi:hypothetical protein
MKPFARAVARKCQNPSDGKFMTQAQSTIFPIINNFRRDIPKTTVRFIRNSRWLVVLFFVRRALTWKQTRAVIGLFIKLI